MLERAGYGAFEDTLHGGSGTSRFQWYFLDRSRLPVAVQRWELPPGASEGMHAHGEDEPLEELYVVLQGTARMHVDEETYDLGPGDAALAPVGADHDLVNVGGDALQVMVVWGPPGEYDWSRFGTARAARGARGASNPEGRAGA